MAVFPKTLGGMKARIARELSRSNLTDDIADAISDAISIYQKERFRFSDIIPSAPPTFNTVNGQWIYTSADNPNISSAYHFDYVQMDLGGSTVELVRWNPGELKLYIQQQTMRGQPSWYAYEGNQLLLAPIPPQAYTITLGLFRNVPAPADDIEVDNPWMVDAEKLIRSRAKYELAINKTRNATMAQLMSPHPPVDNGGVLGAAYDAYVTLKAETNRVTRRGRVRPMAF